MELEFEVLSFDWVVDIPLLSFQNSRTFMCVLCVYYEICQWNAKQ